MKSYFYQGEPVFMSILTLCLFALIIVLILSFRRAYLKKLVKHIGLLAFIIGLLAQLISLYQVMNILQEVGTVSAPMLAGGLKVSIIAPVYGLIIFTIGILGLIIRKLMLKADD